MLADNIYYETYWFSYLAALDANREHRKQSVGTLEKVFTSPKLLVGIDITGYAYNQNRSHIVMKDTELQNVSLVGDFTFPGAYNLHNFTDRPGIIAGFLKTPGVGARLHVDIDRGWRGRFIVPEDSTTQISFEIYGTIFDKLGVSVAGDFCEFFGNFTFLWQDLP